VDIKMNEIIDIILDLKQRYYRDFYKNPTHLIISREKYYHLINDMDQKFIVVNPDRHIVEVFLGMEIVVSENKSDILKVGYLL
jgi:hypothetical protein